MTKYHVLRRSAGQGPSQDVWEIVTRNVEASGAEAAIRKIGADLTGNVELVAVPSRSWAPVKVVIETRKTLKLS